MRFLLIFIVLLLSSAATAVSSEPLQDPLRPGGFSARDNLKMAEEKPPHWQLSAVLISASRQVALLNGRTVAVGDVIEGYRVEAIQRDQVVMNNKKRRTVVRRAGTGLKQVTAADAVVGKKGSLP